MKTIEITIKGVCNTGKSRLTRLISETLAQNGLLHTVDDPDRNFVASRSAENQQSTINTLAKLTADGELEIRIVIKTVARGVISS